MAFVVALFHFVRAFLRNCSLLDAEKPGLLQQLAFDSDLLQGAPGSDSRT